MTKNELRAKMKLLRRDFSGKAEASDKITARLLESDIYKNCERICLYMSAFGEVSTEKILSHALASGKKVCVPISMPDSTLRLSLTDGQFTKGLFGISEPVAPEYTDFSFPELIIVPGLAFDLSCARLGFGMGYYDRFLSEAKGKTIGLGYSFQLLDRIPTDEHDVLLDGVITDTVRIEK